MENSTKIIVGGTLLAAAYFFFKGQADTIIGNIEQKFSGVKWEGIKGARANFSIRYKIKNKNAKTVTVYGFKGLLSWRNTPFADIGTGFTDTNPFQLKQNEEKVFPIYFSLPLVDVVADLAKLLWGQRPTQGANYEGMFVRGDLDAAIGALRAKLPIEQAIVLSI